MTGLIYSIAMPGTTYLIRMLPFTLFRRKIKSKYFKSILYYLPPAVLSAMTFPAIFYSTGNTVCAVFGAVVAALLALLGLPLTVVSVSASVTALICGFIF